MLCFENDESSNLLADALYCSSLNESMTTPAFDSLMILSTSPTPLLQIIGIPRLITSPILVGEEAFFEKEFLIKKMEALLKLKCKGMSLLETERMTRFSPGI